MRLIGYLAAAMVAAATLGILLYGYLPTQWVKYTDQKVLTRLPGEGQLLLTFDDGPDPRYTGKLLDLLQKEHVPAVFFVTAKNARSCPELVKRMQAEGHKVGLHSYRHQNAWFLSKRQTEEDLKRGKQVLEDLGVAVTDYRPPWGHFNWFTVEAARKHGLTIVLWSVMAEDWQKRATVSSITKKLLSRVDSGAIICLHDAGEDSGGAAGGPDKTIAALGAVLPQLKARGYTFVKR